MLPLEFLTTPIAHRGLHDLAGGRPENSLKAFEAAVAQSYGIELDLQLTADDRPLVFHDYDLARLTGSDGRVRDRSLAQMHDLPLVGGTTGAPGLEDVLGMVQGRVPLLIELKDQDGALGENVGPLEAATAKALDGYAGPVAVMSFNPHAVAAMQRLVPDIPRGLVSEEFDPAVWNIDATRAAGLSAVEDYDRVGASFVSHNHKHLSMPRIAELKASGATVLCWTVKSPDQDARAREVADNVTFEGYLPSVPS